MKIRNVVHKGLRRLIERDDPSGLNAAAAEKIRNIVSFLQEMGDVEEVRSVPSWRAHLLAGDRKGVWSLTVTRNWRITFRIDKTEEEIADLDFEDYH
ncbi:MAG: type II toxin-antitoxin system RelE/ParE family toxin [Hyphomicrobiales bacterium]